jgi:hypothetical protein
MWSAIPGAGGSIKSKCTKSSIPIVNGLWFMVYGLWCIVYIVVKYYRVYSIII